MPLRDNSLYKKMTAKITTSALGEIQGRVVDGVVHYLGIQYATLKNRLADAELVTSRPAGSGVLDATKDGPTAASMLAGCAFEQSTIQQTLPPKDLPQSDIHCLNANIAVPEGTTSASKLPVFLFIHGGGLVIGANSWPQFDWTRVVKLSKEVGYPVVAVSINYRLGAFGFLTSEELRRAGYKANNGFRDQRVGIEWVRRHIRDFGGDPDNITLAGMSAGGASVLQHLHSDQPLVRRAIAMSGTNLLIAPLPYEVHEQGYQAAIKAWGLDGLSPEERIKAILETPAQDLITKLPPTVPIGFAVDDDLIPSPPTFAEIGDKNKPYPKGKAWCKELLIGDAEIDGMILAFLDPTLKDNAGERFITAVKKVLADYPEAAEELPRRYGISATASDDEAFPRVLEFINDITFFAPVLTYVRGWPGTAYVYYFNEENPWDGPWKGRASHILDLAYFFQTFNEFLTAEQRAVGQAMVEDFFRFVHGVAPWPGVQAGDVDGKFTARVYGPSREYHTARTVQQPFGGESQRRGILFELVEKHGVPLDVLAQVFLAYRG